MGLLDNVLAAKGDGTPNYAQVGRHVVRLKRVYFRDPSDDPNVEKLAAGLDGEVLSSSAHPKGDVIRANCTFKFPGSDVARMRRALVAGKTSKTGVPCSEADLGIARIDGEDEKVYAKRVGEEAKRLTGPTQPLVGAIVIFQITGGTSKTKKDDSGQFTKYTLFEVLLPNENDLAALLPPTT